MADFERRAMVIHEIKPFYEQFSHLEDEYLENLTYSGGELFEDHRIQSWMVGRYEESGDDARSMVYLARTFGSYMLGKAMALARAMETAESEWEERKTHDKQCTQAFRTDANMARLNTFMD